MLYTTCVQSKHINYTFRQGGQLVELFETWCDCEEVKDNKKLFLKFSERDGGRDTVFNQIVTTVQSHYQSLERIEANVAALGFSDAAGMLRTLMPDRKEIQSGDLGEILATELVEEKIGFVVPVRRLRYKDHRNMAMRGDDFIGAAYEGNDLCLLKGEAKSGASMAKSTIEEARGTLEENYGRCTPSSLGFIAQRLLDSDDEDNKVLGMDIQEEIVRRTLPKRRIEHVLFTMTGNPAAAALQEDFDGADGDRPQYVVNLRIKDHQAFIGAVFEETEKLGDE